MDNGFRRDMNTIDAYGRPGAGSVIARNAVLRNTYWLLALSMVPTVLGAWLGVSLNLGAMMHGGVGTMVFLIGAFGLMFAIEKNKESGVGVVLLLAFTFFMGVMLSSLLSFVLGMANGASLITLAFGGTALIFTGMATLATVSKRDFSGMGKWLFAGALVLMVASIANIFLHIPAMMLAISVLAIVIFSAFMLFDVQRVVNGGETNYISATLAIYLDLYNVFVNLLMILGIFGGNSRD
jgi:modulator of FtsH protease